MAQYKLPKKFTLEKVFPYLLIVTGIIGFIASFVLTLEHIALLKDPAHQLSCSINPILSCGPVMKSDAATLFGFPNSLLGIASFSAQIVLGLSLLAGARLKNWFWKLWGLQVLGSVAFMLFLMQESIFQLKAICIYCMTVWIVLSISSWYTVQFMLDKGVIFSKYPRAKSLLRQYHLDVLVIWFAAIGFVILWEFWYFFSVQLGL